MGRQGEVIEPIVEQEIWRDKSRPVIPRIVFVSGGMGGIGSAICRRLGQTGQTNYSAAKAGMAGFAKALAQEVVRKGVTVNTVSPGYVETDMVMAIRQEVRDQIVAQIPMGRLARPEEIAAVVAFLASDEAGYITGAKIPVHGGMHMM